MEVAAIPADEHSRLQALDDGGVPGSGDGTKIVRRQAQTLGARFALYGSRAGTRVTLRLPSSQEA